VNPLLAPSQAVANQAFTQHYIAWKNTYVTANGAGGHLRVQRTENGKDTVSEGIGYGMLLAAYKGDRATFDGLWGYAKAHMNHNGLMKWHLDPNGKPIDDNGPGSGSNAATDGDEDMALALVVADGKWGGYKADATRLINAIMTHEVEAGTNVLKPGDVWGGSDQTNPSYFAPAYYKVFQKYTGDARWGAVADKAYEVLNKAANPTTGLVPKMVNADGKALPGDQYGYDAMRTPWRIAMDAVWNNDPRAIAFLTRINAFFKQQGVKNIYDVYTTTGQPQSRNHNAAAVSMAATAAIIDSDGAYRQSFWSETLVVPGNNYYNDSLRTLSLLLIGNLMTKP
jgi:endo-1,4-beta-D-glucanase Y